MDLTLPCSVPSCLQKAWWGYETSNVEGCSVFWITVQLWVVKSVKKVLALLAENEWCNPLLHSFSCVFWWACFQKQDEILFLFCWWFRFEFAFQPVHCHLLSFSLFFSPFIPPSLSSERVLKHCRCDQMVSQSKLVPPPSSWFLLGCMCVFIEREREREFSFLFVYRCVLCLPLCISALTWTLHMHVLINVHEVEIYWTIQWTVSLY